MVSPEPYPPVPPLEILPLREQARVRDTWLLRRLETVVPHLLAETGIDMWLLVAREYNEDPVLRTMLPAEWLSARRRTILLFHRKPGSVETERLAVARYSIGSFFVSAWDPATQPDQWARLAELIAERDPKAIAVDMSSSFAHADGLAATEHGLLLAALPAVYRARVVSAERLAVGWLETRIPEEMALYPGLCRFARTLIHDGFREAIEPGRTTTTDLVWWYRERIQSHGLAAWFHPTVELQRDGPPDPNRGFADKNVEETIEPGDLVHVDLGVVYMGLHTDTQQHAYVLRPGERLPPEGLRAGIRACNRAQDIVLRELRTGRSGNDVLAAALAECRRAKLEATIYSHPLGLHGHAAGATIGLWDQQSGVRGSGDYPVRPQTVWSIELNVRVAVPEWQDRAVLFMLEEDAFLDGAGASAARGARTPPAAGRASSLGDHGAPADGAEASFLDGRQTELAVVASERARGAY